MNRSTITAAALAGFALALAAGYLLAQDRTADSWDPDPEHGRFQIIHAAPAGTFLLNTRNGDSWRWYYTPRQRQQTRVRRLAVFRQADAVR